MGNSLAPGRVQVWLLPQLEISEVAVHETGEPSALSTSLSGSFERPTRDAFLLWMQAAAVQRAPRSMAVVSVESVSRDFYP